jgi:hypothetical protein
MATKPLLAALLLVAAGCATTIPREALELRPDSLARRQLQTRRFDGLAEKDLLAASAGVLQDLGFNIDEGESRLGLIVASKDRSAVETGQVIGALLLTIFDREHRDHRYDKSQQIKVSLVTRPLNADRSSNQLRITLQRVVRDNRDEITRLESIEDSDIYQQFFDKLSKSVFLEAHSI